MNVRLELHGFIQILLVNTIIYYFLDFPPLSILCTHITQPLRFKLLLNPDITVLLFNGLVGFLGYQAAGGKGRGAKREG